MQLFRLGYLDTRHLFLQSSWGTGRFLIRCFLLSTRCNRCCGQSAGAGYCCENCDLMLRRSGTYIVCMGVMFQKIFFFETHIFDFLPSRGVPLCKNFSIWAPLGLATGLLSGSLITNLTLFFFSNLGGLRFENFKKFFSKYKLFNAILNFLSVFRTRILGWQHYGEGLGLSGAKRPERA